MKFAVTGIGAAVPARVVTNEELGERLGVEPGWIEVRTGINERRYAGEGESAATLGVKAAREACEVAGVRAEDVDMIIAATCTGDYLFPSTATLIQDALGAGSAAAFDLGAACSGFIYGLTVGASMLAAGSAHKVLVIGTEVLSRFTNMDDPVTAPLFGDGAAAVLIEADPAAEEFRVELGADGSNAEQVWVPAGGGRTPTTAASLESGLNRIHMVGREVYRAAVRTMTAMGESLGGDFDLLVAHQANKRIIDDCAANLGVPSEKVFLNIDRYGNTSAASIPLAIYEAWRTGRLRPGHRVLMLAFGSGYTWGGGVIRWTIPTPAAAGAELETGALTAPEGAEAEPAGARSPA